MKIRINGLNWFTDKDWKEEEHPRSANGEFGSGGASKKTHHWTMEGDKKPTDSQIERLKKLRVPPAWTGIRLSTDEKADLQVVGKDAKGRTQYLYSAEHSERAAAEKFARLKEFNKVANKISDSAKKDMLDKNQPDKVRDAAAITYLISQTGFRIGSETNTQAEVQAFGASTLKGSHVQVKGDVIDFEFIGKKGVSIKKQLVDKSMAKYITDRKKQVGDEGKLFTASDASTRDYFKANGGTNFKVKDFRTWVGTQLALKEMVKPPPVKTEKDLISKKKDVAKVVSSHLGNTPTVAIQSYIDPAVWRYKQPISEKTMDAKENDLLGDFLECTHYDKTGDWKNFDDEPTKDNNMSNLDELYSKLCGKPTGDGDFPGHPFRGNQFAKGKSGGAEKHTRHANRVGTAAAHKRAHEAHTRAAAHTSGVTKAHHLHMAKEHAKIHKRLSK